MKVEIRTHCKVCGKEISEKRFRSYCSLKCRNKFNNIKNREKNAKGQRERRDRKALDPTGKCKCLICGLWYVQFGSHIVQRHKITAREYREQFNLEVKKGIVPNYYRKFKGEQAIENGTYKNLEIGKKHRFVKGDKKAGRYKRSPITMERLKTLYKYNKLK